jgi:hypothetical protein
MSDYPPAVAAIAADYLDRVRALVPPAAVSERDDLVRELQSHLYEAYQQAPGGDDVARILAVLRRLGEPADVVSERLPQAIVRTAAAGRRPLHLLGGIVVALFGVPLGLAGVAVLAGMLVSLAGVLVAHYAVAVASLLSGVVCVALGLVRIYGPELWDKLVALGIVNLPPGSDHLSPSTQGVLLLVCGTLFVALAGGLFWLGARLARGLWFLFGLAWDGARRLAQSARGTLTGQKGPLAGAPPPAAHVAGRSATNAPRTTATLHTN